MMAVKQLHPLFFGEISGIDLAAPLQPADRKAIAEAIDPPLVRKPASSEESGT